MMSGPIFTDKAHVDLTDYKHNIVQFFCGECEQLITNIKLNNVNDAITAHYLKKHKKLIKTPDYAKAKPGRIGKLLMGAEE